ncbi:MAG TPA: PDZ domain-containing protein [Gammaproteobacteria bacterium]|nr:PDZ domain-containing protein [Gammaproteobacteria bacterium]
MNRIRILLMILLLPGAGSAATPQNGVGGLTLTGVVMNRAGNVALINRKGRGDHAFKAGDHVMPDVVLMSIEATQVHVRVDGTDRVLTLAGLAHDRQQLHMPIPAQPAHADAFLVPMPGITYIGDYHFIITRRKLRDFLASTNALSEARWLLLQDGGLFVAHIKQGSAYEKAGLHVGDVILSINGTRLASHDDVLAVYKRLDTLDHLDLHITRMGQDQHLVYDIKP